MMKTISIFIVLLIAGHLLWQGCAEQLTAPESVQFDVCVRVQDTTFITPGMFGSFSVPDAEVNLFSINYGINYTARSDSSGRAFFSNVIPDLYNCSIQKIYPEDTVQKYLGIKQEQILIASLPVVQLVTAADSFRVHLKPVSRSPLVISEIYYNGAKPPPAFYFHDQFTEIYNNSAEVEYLDNYVIGDAIYGYRDDPDYVHCERLYGFPGSGTDFPIYPGEMIIIAQDAINHTEINKNSLDLTIADFEYYNYLSNDVDNPLVLNMEQIHHKFGYDFLYSVMNDAIILARLEPGDTLTYDSKDNILVPIARVIDAVEYKEDLTNYNTKYLSDNLDAGLTGGLPSYQGKVIARKIFKVVEGQILLMDNNNSSLDFEVRNTPTPGWIE